MNIETIKIGGNEYKLYLSTQAAIDIEKKLGKSLLSVMGSMASSSVPDIKTEELLVIFHGLLQKFNANITMAKTLELYDLMRDCEDDYENGPYVELLTKCITCISSSFFGKMAQQPQK